MDLETSQRRDKKVRKAPVRRDKKFRLPSGGGVERGENEVAESSIRVSRSGRVQKPSARVRS